MFKYTVAESGSFDAKTDTVSRTSRSLHTAPEVERRPGIREFVNDHVEVSQVVPADLPVETREEPAVDEPPQSILCPCRS